MPPLIRRRPLLRATAIGGGAYYAGKRRMDVVDQLTQLGKLREHGVLTDEEFAQRKARLLGG
jgi:hypothetical protein